MCVGLAPICGLYFACAVWEFERDSDAAGRDDPHGDQVARGMTHRLHFERSAIVLEMAKDNAVPQVQRLLNVAHRVRRRLTTVEQQSNAAEMESMRIGAQPIAFGSSWLRHVGVAHFATEDVELFVAI